MNLFQHQETGNSALFVDLPEKGEKSVLIELTVWIARASQEETVLLDSDINLPAGKFRLSDTRISLSQS